jgi:hypothetical protein
MLFVNDRELFLNALKPPDGYQFDRGVGTTFTLDLLTLLIAPVSLALFDSASADEALQDLLLPLESLRRYAERLSIFCNSGYISIPKRVNYLFSYLEDMVVEVQAPNGGYFHPKVWLLRFINQTRPPIHRLLCLSRNLTFDRSWDLMVQLEGEVAAHRKVGYSQNRPLGDFIQTLPDLALQKPSTRILEDIDLLSNEVRRVVFDVPDSFADNIAYYPSGIPGYRSYRFKGPYRRMLVVSPFLTNGFLNEKTGQGQNHVLISRIDSIDDLSSHCRKRFKDIYVLDDDADTEIKQLSPEDIMLESETQAARPRETELSGLHAKLFVLEDNKFATWLIGSANATDAAYRGRNVEFMIEFKGRNYAVGIEKILGDEKNQYSLRALLNHYPHTRTKAPKDDKQAKVENLVDDVREWLVNEKLDLVVMASGEDNFDLTLRKKTKSLPPAGDYQISCWPISLKPDQRQIVQISDTSEAAKFENISILSLTPFIAFEVEAKQDSVRALIQFVLRLPISGLPEQRDDYIFGAIISNRMQFLRYLRLLLAGEYGFQIPELTYGAGKGRKDFDISWEDLDLPLLEEMVRALSRSPKEKIDRIARIVEQLERTPDGKTIIPEEFNLLWEAIIKARSDIE